MSDYTALATRLDRAVQAAEAITQLTATDELDVPGSYQTQQQLVGLRLARGETLVGIKMGLTSRAKMDQVGVDQPIWGRLTDAMRIDDGGHIQLDRLIHPRVEPEIAFRLDAAGAPTAAATALEVIDSRYQNFQFTLPDVIADNTSAAGYVLGPWRPIPDGVDNLGVLLEVDGQVVQAGSTAAILGDPRRALAHGLEQARTAGLTPQSGWVLLAGAATAAVPLARGAHIRAVVESLGTAVLHAGSAA